MRWFNNLRIHAKMLIGFVLVSMIAVAVGYAGLLKMRTMDRRDQELYKYNTVPISLISDASTAYQRMRIATRDAVIYIDEPERQKEILASIKELDATIHRLLDEFEKRIVTKDVAEEFKILKATLENYGPAREKLLQLAAGGEQKKALFLLKREGASVAKAVDDSIIKLKEMEVTEAGVKAAANSATAVEARRFTIAISAVGALLAMLLGLVLSRTINRPLRMAVDFTNTVAGGDFTQQLSLDRKDEVGELTTSLNSMCITLEGMIAGARRAAEDLLKSAAAQAACIEQTSASVNDISSRAGEIAQRANMTDDLMRHSLSMIDEAKKTMQALVNAIHIIEEAGSETAKIVKTIDGIAFQTTLLALNASVEAARAGEAGAGFAVVAEEVRNLAIRTAQAAKQSAELTQKASAQIREGSRLAADLNESFSKAAENAQKSGAFSAEISLVLREQVDGTNQISSVLNQMSEATQMHNQICDDLVESMKRFRVSDEEEEETLLP